MTTTFKLKTNQPGEMDTKVDPKNKKKTISVPREMEIQIDEADFETAVKTAIPWLNAEQIHTVKKDPKTEEETVVRSAALHPRSGPTHVQGKRVWATILPDHEEHPAIAFITNGLMISEALKKVFRGIVEKAVQGTDFSITGDKMGPQGHSMYIHLSPRAGESLVRCCDNARAGCPDGVAGKEGHEAKLHCRCGWYGRSRGILRLPAGWK